MSSEEIYGVVLAICLACSVALINLAKRRRNGAPMEPTIKQWWAAMATVEKLLFLLNLGCVILVIILAGPWDGIWDPI